jgi:hypothetical protein
MKITLAVAIALAAQLCSAQTLESSYDEAIRMHGRVSPRIRACWSRGESASADAAGMPLTVCVDRLRVAGKLAGVDGFAILPGGRREPLVDERSLYGGAGGAWIMAYTKDAGSGEFDEESVFQLAFKLDANGSVTGELKPTAFHQCPERGCTYACGMTTVEFKPAADPTAFTPRTSY